MNIKVVINGREIQIGKVISSSWPKFSIELINGYKIFVNVDSSTFEIEEKEFGIIGNAYNINDTIEIMREISGLRETSLTALREAIEKEYNYLTNNGRCVVIF